MCSCNIFNILNTSSWIKTLVPVTDIYSKMPLRTLTVQLLTAVCRLLYLTLLCLFFFANMCMKKVLNDKFSILCFFNMCYSFVIIRKIKFLFVFHHNKHVMIMWSFCMIVIMRLKTLCWFVPLLFSNRRYNNNNDIHMT